MLIDEAEILIKAGSGGNGSASFKRNAQTARGGPDGGNGGIGGNVYVQGVDDISLLIAFRYTKEVKAEDGVNGGKQNLYGRNGKDTIINVPLGTVIKDLKTNEVFEVNSTDKFLIARGGKGGRGNNEFKSATNQAPKFAEKGEKGQERRVLIELKLIADVGLIGLPNSGKSTLLSVLTNAHPKIGDYPFTTLEPNLGVMDGLIISDIPGLIEGASEGKGLGIKFLKHVEKTKILVHCIDINNEDIKRSYETIRKELSDYDEKLAQKREVILLTKSDLLEKKEIDKKIKIASKLNSTIFVISVYDDKSINDFKESLINFIKGWLWNTKGIKFPTMENPELSKKLRDEINEIFIASFPGEVKYRKCDGMIDKVKKHFTEVSGRRFEGPDRPSHLQLGFVVGINSSNQRYEVTYFRYYSANSEERLTIVKNRQEKVNLKTRKYADGRLDASVEYYDDAPEFKRTISDHFETNVEMSEVIVDELAHLLKKLK